MKKGLKVLALQLALMLITPLVCREWNITTTSGNLYLQPTIGDIIASSNITLDTMRA